jgi:hypothetical protein
MSEQSRELKALANERPLSVRANSPVWLRGSVSSLADEVEQLTQDRYAERIVVGQWMRRTNYWRERAEQAEAELERVREFAKSARSTAAAPDYDELAIKDALWAVVDAALADKETP